MTRLLLLEDDQTLGATLKERLELEGYEVVWVESCQSAEESYSQKKFDLIILDIGLPDGSGLEFAKKVRSQSSCPFIFVTAQNSAETRLEGFEIGAEEFIPKPFHLKEMLLRIRHVLENHKPQGEVRVGDKRSQLGREFVSEKLDRGAEQVGRRSAQQQAAVRAALHHQHPRIVEHQHRTVGLNRARKVDELALTVR